MKSHYSNSTGKNPMYGCSNAWWCCGQVRPLRRQLTGLKAWITGQRKDQSPGTRQAVPVIQVDPAFEGKDGGAGSLVKYNPLSNVTSSEVWNFLRVMVRPRTEIYGVEASRSLVYLKLYLARLRTNQDCVLCKCPSSSTAVLDSSGTIFLLAWCDGIMWHAGCAHE